MKKINDIFNNWMITKPGFGGIFCEMNRLVVREDFPWENDVNWTELDLQYHGNHSGGKFASPLLEEVFDNPDMIESEKYRTIANVVYSLNIKRWSELYKTLQYEYNPIENYNMVEHEETDRDNKNDNSIYAFNSSDNPEPSDTNAGHEDTKRDFTRAGNIGVMSTQDLIEQQRRVWMWNYFEVVFSDIDKTLALKIY